MIDAENKWHREFVQAAKSITGCTHEQAMELLGKVCEITQQVYMQGYNNGVDGEDNNA